MSDAATQENKERSVLKIEASREGNEYQFCFYEGVTYAEMSDVLLQMRDHVVYIGRVEAAQKAKEAAEKDKED